MLKLQDHLSLHTRNSLLPWITHEINHQIRKKDRFHKRGLCYQKPDHWVAFVKQGNLPVSRLVKESHSDYLRMNLKDNPQDFGLMSDLVNQRKLVYFLCDLAISCVVIKSRSRLVIPICTRYLPERNCQFPPNPSLHPT